MQGWLKVVATRAVTQGTKKGMTKETSKRNCQLVHAEVQAGSVQLNDVPILLNA